MSERWFNKSILMAFLVAMVFCLLLMALHYVWGIHALLYAEAKDSITEIAAQGAGRLTDTIQLQVAEVRKNAAQLTYSFSQEGMSKMSETPKVSETPDMPKVSETPKGTLGSAKSLCPLAPLCPIPSSDAACLAQIKEYFLALVQREGLNSCLTYALAFPNGKALREDGHIFDVTGELGFQRALRGLSNASEPFYSVYSGLRVLGFYSPVVVHGRVVAVLRVAASVDCFYETFGTPFYGGHGLSYILSTTGRLIAGSQDRTDVVTFSNIFDLLDKDLDAAGAVQQLRDDMGQGKQGVISLKLGLKGPSYLICYVPLTAGLDWYFVSMVPEKVVFENSRQVILRSILLCGGVILVLFVGVMLYLRERSKNQEHILKLAFIDELTGLPNRNRLMEDKKLFFRKTEQFPYAMVVFDIDNFKMINESFGYKTGDRVLLCATAVINEEVDPLDELRARTGGDQFVLVLRYPHEDRTALKCRLQDLLNKIRGMAEQEAIMTGSLSFSCGVCQVTPKLFKGSKCYDYADIARKSVKNQNGTSVGFFEEDMLMIMQQEKEIERAMDKALADGEFQVYLQPKIDLLSEELKGAEALVRWIRPGKGCVSPLEFIPLFERNGFVVKLDYAVMEQVCQRKRRWRELGLPDRVISVNMSQYHLVHKDFVSTLEAIARKYDVAPESLEIEITESAFYSDTTAYAMMEEIKAVGFKLSMDDFGAGYSTLNMLRRMPIDVLKIDKQFLDESEASERTRAIISSIIHMAYNLGADVICEGVETLRQVEFLKGIGCRLAQGYFYSRPLPMCEFEEKYLGIVPPAEGEKAQQETAH